MSLLDSDEKKLGNLSIERGTKEGSTTGCTEYFRTVLTLLCHSLAVLEHTDTNIICDDICLNLDVY